jgi:hypothetical protein
MPEQACTRPLERDTPACRDTRGPQHTPRQTVGKAHRTVVVYGLSLFAGLGRVLSSGFPPPQEAVR